MSLFLFSILLTSILFCGGYGNWLGEEEYITEVNGSTYRKIFSQRTKKDYLVYFYMPDCPGCEGFVPDLKNISTSIKASKNLLQIFAMNGENETEINAQIEAGAISSDLIYYPNGHSGIKGAYKINKNTVEIMVNNILSFVANYSKNPIFKPIEDQYWTKKIPKSYILLKNMIQILALKTILSFTENLKYPILWSHTSSSKTIYFEFYKRKLIKRVNVTSGWESFNESFKLLNVWKDLPEKSTKSPLPSTSAPLPPNGNRTIVNFADLHSTLDNVLYKSINRKLNGTKEQTDVLRQLMNILVHYFNAPENLKNSLLIIQKSLENKQVVSRNEWMSILKKSGFPRQEEVWITCWSRLQGVRGINCGTWLLFHALTVAEWEKIKGTPSDAAPKVLPAMKTYIANFFHCDPCIIHFAKESANLTIEVTNSSSAVLWLWKTHNQVNWRLKNKTNQDPEFPKLQVPTKKQCDSCQLGGEGEFIKWNEKNVLHYLSSRFTSSAWGRARK